MPRHRVFNNLGKCKLDMNNSFHREGQRFHEASDAMLRPRLEPVPHRQAEGLHRVAAAGRGTGVPGRPALNDPAHLTSSGSDPPWNYVEVNGRGLRKYTFPLQTRGVPLPCYSSRMGGGSSD